jgi:amino acid adenylation domain-containing protein
MNDRKNLVQPLEPPDVEHDPFADAPRYELTSTPAQLEMWLSEQSGDGAGCAYNESFSICLDGHVDEASLRRALQILGEFHEALRGHFSADGQRFVIEPQVVVPVAHHDLSTLPMPEREQQLLRLTTKDSVTPYSLEMGPLVRAAIIRLTGRSCIVLLSAHHAVCDGWSLDVLLSDLGRLYSAFAGGSPLPAPPRHAFGDYVNYCAAPESLARIEASRAFWHRKLDVLPVPLALPSDGRRPAVRSYGANHAAYAVPAELLTQIRAFARGQGLSTFSVLFSVFSALLHRLSGSSDLIVGIPVAGHAEAGMEDCVGHLVSLVPVRCVFEAGKSFEMLCRENYSTILDARENAWVGFGEIVRDVHVPRDPSRVPLVAATFTHVQKYAPGKLAFADCSVTYRLNARSFETFELSLNAVEAHDGLEFHAHANSDLYSQEWLSWRLRELECLLRDACRSPSTTIDRLALLPSEERAVIDEKFNDTIREYPRDMSLVGLFEEQLVRTPKAIAVQFGQELITYEELEARANRLAHALRRRGVERGVLVGLCLERSIDMVVALLAVLKAGGGYVPLDPGFPGERLAYMVEDSKLALVVSISKLVAVHGCKRDKTIELDTDVSDLKRESRDRLVKDQRAYSGDDVAYVLYTSGSTGKPKGVCVHHRAAVNFLSSMQRDPGLRPEDRLLAVTTLSFDIALLELMLPLSVGAQIVLASREQSMDGEALHGLLGTHAITVMQATPATWRLLLASGWKGSAEFKALCGGEALPLDLAEALLDRVGELWNMYGPTETTVWSTCERVSNPREGITIGRPIANTSVWILDKEMQICPIGVAGEIHIGGDGVALGYLNLPGVTAKRFIPDPFAKESGLRLYRTGDLGRWRNDGKLECLGRMDFQVKVRGFRIELGEIESVLSCHVAVRQAVVMAREDRVGDTRLVAYLIVDGPGVEEQELRLHARRSLPDYMVPQHFVVVEAFPTTPNGKIDRKALPPPDAQLNVVASRAPSTPTEVRLTEIWKRLLKRDTIGIDDDFFDVGGHSLLTMTLVSQIEKEFKIRLSLSDVLQSPTVSGLSDCIAASVGSSREVAVQGDFDRLVVLKEGGPKRLFFVFDGFGEVLPYLNLSKRMPPQYSVNGIRPCHLPGIPLPHITIPDIAKCCVEQMRRLQPQGPYTIGGLCAGGVIAFCMAEQLERDKVEVERLILLDAVAPTTATRPWYIQGKRWQRFSGTLRQVWRPAEEYAASSAQARALASNSALLAILKKIGNLAEYETLHFIESLSVAARLRLMNYVLTKKSAWPQWAPPLNFSDIYANARASYSPGCIEAPIILVRAQEGADGDAPATDYVVDPYLGWREHTLGSLDVIDAVGGHSSMLQEPNVELVARRITGLLEFSEIDQTVSRTTK